MMKRAIATIMAILFLFSLSAEAKGKGGREGEETSYKTIQGEVAVTRPNFIAITYERIVGRGGEIAEKEITFPIDEKVEFSRVKNIGEIKEGDTVKIAYEETTYTDKNGIGRIERKARQVTLIKTAVKGLRSQ